MHMTIDNTKIAIYWIFIYLFSGCSSDTEFEDRRMPSQSNEALSHIKNESSGCHKEFEIRNGLDVESNADLSKRYQSVGRVKIKTSPTSFRSCTGTLVSPNVVLTARHCIAFDALQTAVVSPSIVEFEIAGIPDPNQVKEIIIKPEEFRDIALLVLESPLPLSVPISNYLKSSTRPMNVGDELQIVGFGNYYNSSNPSAGVTLGKKKSGTMRYDSDIQKNLTGTNTLYHKLVPTGLNQNVCRGDSGGPLFAELNGELTIVGVISHMVVPPNVTEDRYCKEISNGNFTRIVDTYSWITATIKENEVIVLDDVAPEIKSRNFSYNVTGNKIEVAWEQATDLGTLPQNLQYQVFYKKGANLDAFSTVAGIFQFGTAVESLTRNLRAETIDSLDFSTDYVVGLVVQDEGGNISAYDSAIVKTFKESELVALESSSSVTDATEEIGHSNPSIATITPKQVKNVTTAKCK